MPIDPTVISRDIAAGFRRYLETAFAFPKAHTELRRQFAEALAAPGRLTRGPFLHGLAPYKRDVSVAELIRRGVLPKLAADLPILEDADRPLYAHQVRAIELVRAGRNAIVSSGTGSGKTLSFLTPILSSVLQDQKPGVHALLLYPMNALVNDQLKTLRRVLAGSSVTFGRYVNIETTPNGEREARNLYRGVAPANEVVSREAFRVQPPHLLVTNYAMLEYLLMRADDTPLFTGPWRFVVVDEAHTYAGTKGSEVALLLRRLVARVKKAGEKPPQFIATSASLGTDDSDRRAEVLDFARTLFDAEFAESDLISAEREATPTPGEVEPDAGIYTHAAVAAACESGAKWTPQLSAALATAGFPAGVVETAAKAGLDAAEYGLFEAFRHDARVARLRTAAGTPTELSDVAEAVFGHAGAVSELCGLVRVSSLARVPGGDARLVPCRYHLFVRGLSGASVALSPGKSQARPTLLLDESRELGDGRRAFPLYACRKCGLPYLVGHRVGDELRPVRQTADDRVGPGADSEWFVWSDPNRGTTDDDELEEVSDVFTAHSLDPETGELRELAAGALAGGCVKVWKVCDGAKVEKCVGCRGRDDVTPIRADSDAAQAVVAAAFYRALPESTNPDALAHPGGGRKLLAFADSRQSAAYFAPYLERRNRDQLMRRLVYQSTVAAAARLECDVDGDTLITRMSRDGAECGIFPADMPLGEVREACARAIVGEFCLPFNRRHSLEALGLVACSVDLRRWVPPPELADWLSPDDAAGVLQVLLGSVRLVKAIELPEEVSPQDPEFRYAKGLDAFIAEGSQPRHDGGRLHGFGPAGKPECQRRSAYLQRVMAAVKHDSDAVRILDAVWATLLKGPNPVLARVQVAPGAVGFQLRWSSLRLRPGGDWFVCSDCGQWQSECVLGVCPSVGCDGVLSLADPEAELTNHHYRRAYREIDTGPVPLVAKEHTAQLGPDLATQYQFAFQDGHHSAVGPINVLSCSTTFELGVDLGDLEAVLLRNVPPSPANYQQRAGRAGRGVGAAAFAVTFAQSRSHDQHYYADPTRMIDGLVRPPKIDLRNEIIYLRHVTAVLLAGFVRLHHPAVRTIDGLLPRDGSRPLDDYRAGLGDAVARNARALDKLIPGGLASIDRAELVGKLDAMVGVAERRYVEEVAMYDSAIADAQRDEEGARSVGNTSRARARSSFAYSLLERLETFRRQDWVSYLSDQTALPSYAFPIHSVRLETADKSLKLDRDLRVALAEYVPGAAVVARGKLWTSVGVRKPYQRELERKHYARCPACQHVMKHLEQGHIFPTGSCPVCGHDGVAPQRKLHTYLVPDQGFTTEISEPGKELDFAAPHRVRTSRVLFVPPQGASDEVHASLEGGGTRVEVRALDRAEFFVFSAGDEPDGMGFRLCRFCLRAVAMKTSGKGKNKIIEVEPHKTPLGRDCAGKGAERVHLGHDFYSSAARLAFTGTGKDYTDHAFWLSLAFAVLGGVTDALGVEAADVNAVTRPVPTGGGVTQEVVVFDDVPGGAGHSTRLRDAAELRQTLRAAYDRVRQCECGESASCYRCLRSFRNQFCHDQLARGPVADYLGRLLGEESLPV